MNGHRRKQYRKSKIVELLDELESIEVNKFWKSLSLWLVEVEARYLIWRERHTVQWHEAGTGLRRAFILQILWWTYQKDLPPATKQ